MNWHIMSKNEFVEKMGSLSVSATNQDSFRAVLGSNRGAFSVPIEARRVLTFKPSALLRDAINR